jgi:hypothetical protein
MESDKLIRKLAMWPLILEEYDFDIIHKSSRVNQDVDGLSCNPSFNEEDTTKVHWHGNVNL